MSNRELQAIIQLLDGFGAAPRYFLFMTPAEYWANWADLSEDGEPHRLDFKKNYPRIPVISVWNVDGYELVFIDPEKLREAQINASHYSKEGNENSTS